MRLLDHGLMLALPLFVAGCATTMTVSSHALEGADFAQYRTYDWGPADALPTGDPRLDKDPFFLDHFEGAVEIGLARKGLTRTTDAPDLLVHYHANITQRIDINRIDRERGYCHDADCRVRVVEAESGTLVLDVIDARTNRLIWRGWAQRTVADMLTNRDTMELKINEAVDRMLQQFPTGRLESRAVPAQTGER